MAMVNHFHKGLLLLFCIGSIRQVSAQSVGIPLHSPVYTILDRLEIITGIKSPMHQELKFGNRRDAVLYVQRLDSLVTTKFPKQDRDDIQYVLEDSNEFLPDSSHSAPPAGRKGVFKSFYPTPASFFAINTPNFKLRANPMLNFSLGHEAGDSALLFENQRGFEVRGVIDHKLFFYSNLVESQARYPQFVNQRIAFFSAIPGAGFYKPHNSRLFKAKNGYDFNVATAYVGFQATRHFGIQLGHGKHFIGNGYRSMLLSDFGAPTFFLKLDTRIWKIHYQNLFLELSPVSQVNIPDGTLLPKKYAAIHYLNFKISPKLAIGLFEATIFNRNNHFEFQYLNPVILYRTVEGMIGSPDNVLIGMDGRLNLFHKFQLYGQVMIDEWVSAEVFSGKGWWANKWGLQAGLKYINAFGLEHLDLQLEHNRARPFTYSHADPSNSYTHYNQALAHPLGANFAETLLMVCWKPTKRLSIQSRYIYIRQGDNAPDANWGTDPLLNYDTRVLDYGNKIGQGVAAKVNIVALEGSWMLWHNVFLDLNFRYRRKNSASNLLDLKTQAFGLGIRVNMWNPSLDF